MRFKLHPVLLVVLVAAVCGCLVAVLVVMRGHHRDTSAELVAHFPAGDSLIVSIDVAALRRSGLLSEIGGTTIEEEPEYKAFVAGTGFDYERDLDRVVAAFHNNATYFLVSGRFDWAKLKEYVVSSRGACHNTRCRMNGSTPKRNISFFPLAPDVMALAVSEDSWAASMLASRQTLSEEAPYPSEPVWVLIPAAFLRYSPSLPVGPSLFAKAMEGAKRIVLYLGPKGGGLEMVLDVTCRSAQDASVLSAQLEGITRQLRELVAREHQPPDPPDLSSVLVAGKFERLEARVLGRWPLDRAFLAKLASGSL